MERKKLKKKEGLTSKWREHMSSLMNKKVSEFSSTVVRAWGTDSRYWVKRHACGKENRKSNFKVLLILTATLTRSQDLAGSRACCVTKSFTVRIASSDVEWCLQKSAFVRSSAQTHFGVNLPGLSSSNSFGLLPWTGGLIPTVAFRNWDFFAISQRERHLAVRGAASFARSFGDIWGTTSAFWIDGVLVGAVPNSLPVVSSLISLQEN